MYGGPNRGWNQPPPGNGYGQRQPQQPQQGYGGYQQQQQQQQQPYQQYPPQQPRLPNRPGLGANNNHNSFNNSSNNQPLGIPDSQKFQLFVGSLAAGVDDGWLEKVLAVAGPVLSLRRPTPAFAFVEYGDPESVLRCLDVVNGAEICPPDGSPKALLVKADEKTRARLDQYESERVKTESHEDALGQAQSDLLAILSLIRSGAAPSSGPAPKSAAQLAEEAASARAAADLLDLEEKELPEEHREIITGEIALFRERMAKAKAKKAEEAKQREAQIKAMTQRSAAPSPPVAGSRFASSAQDPQSYNKPIGFVAQGSGTPGAEGARAEVAAAPQVTDVEKERLRAERVAREADALFRDRERRYEQRERGRIVGVERERARERQVAEQEDRERSSMAERLALWDDDREADKGRELYYSDRTRWRAQRALIRQREIEADERDRAAEEAQLVSLSKQADDFLSNALPDLKPSAAGRASEGPAVKVSFGAGATKPVAKPAPVVRTGVMGLADEEDEVKKKRELIPLSYSDDEDDHKRPKAEGGLTVEQVLADVPEDQAGLWAYNIKWRAVTKRLVETKIEPFTSSLIVESLGETEPELLSAVTEHVLAHKGAAELVDELEAVLDEEAVVFVTKIWRVLANESEVAAAGLS